MADDTPKDWKDLPDKSTPATAAELERIEKQLIPIFTDATARDAQITSPEQGQKCFITGLGDFGLEFFYNGSAWVPVSGQVIATDTGVPDVTIPAGFSRFHVSASGGHNDGGTWRDVLLRVNGLSADYRTSRHFLDADGAASNVGFASTSAVFVGRWGQTSQQTIEIDIIDSGATTTVTSQSWGYDAATNSDPAVSTGGGRIVPSAAIDQIQLLVSGATIQCATFSVYGYV